MVFKFFGSIFLSKKKIKKKIEKPYGRRIFILHFLNFFFNFLGSSLGERAGASQSHPSSQSQPEPARKKKIGPGVPEPQKLEN